MPPKRREEGWNMKQTERLLAWFATGRSITPLEALDAFGCFRLGARVYDLRKAGHLIERELIEVATAHGAIARVARYTYLGAPDVSG